VEPSALIFDIKRDCSEDGPGIRTTVFFKGCPLSCTWCQNPEGNNNTIQLSFNQQACQPKLCGVACVPVCEASCLQFHDNTLHVTNDLCTRCDHCFEQCPTAALTPVGYSITLSELLYRVMIDQPFYHATGGGITFSGGEATQQMTFIHFFLQALKTRDIHCALETSGFFHYPTFKEQILPYLDLVYFDLKLMDEQASIHYTGQSNRLILENFSHLAAEPDIQLMPRIPLIPEITTTQENLAGIANFLTKHGIHQANLLPYNPLWQDKTKRLNITPKYHRKSYMTSTEKARCIRYFTHQTNIEV